MSDTDDRRRKSRVRFGGAILGILAAGAACGPAPSDSGDGSTDALPGDADAFAGRRFWNPRLVHVGDRWVALGESDAVPFLAWFDDGGRLDSLDAAPLLEACGVNAEMAAVGETLVIVCADRSYTVLVAGVVDPRTGERAPRTVEERTVAADGREVRELATAGGSSGMLAVWSSRPAFDPGRDGGGEPGVTVWAARVAQDGRIEEPRPVVEPTATWGAWAPAVRSAGEGWVVAWVDGRGGSGNQIRAVGVDPDGSPIGESAPAATPAASPLSVALADHAGVLHALWTSREGGTAEKLAGVVPIGGDGGPLGPAFAVGGRLGPPARGLFAVPEGFATSISSVSGGGHCVDAQGRDLGPWTPASWVDAVGSDGERLAVLAGDGAGPVPDLEFALCPAGPAPGEPHSSEPSADERSFIGAIDLGPVAARRPAVSWCGDRFAIAARRADLDGIGVWWVGADGGPPAGPQVVPAEGWLPPDVACSGSRTFVAWSDGESANLAALEPGTAGLLAMERIPSGGDDVWGPALAWEDDGLRVVWPEESLGGRVLFFLSVGRDADLLGGPPDQVPGLQPCPIVEMGLPPGPATGSQWDLAEVGFLRDPAGRAAPAASCTLGTTYPCGCCSCYDRRWALRLPGAVDSPDPFLSWTGMSEGMHTVELPSLRGGALGSWRVVGVAGSLHSAFGGFETWWAAPDAVEVPDRRAPGTEGGTGWLADGWVAGAGEETLVVWVETPSEYGRFPRVLHAQRRLGPDAGRAVSPRIAGGLGQAAAPAAAWSGSVAGVAWIDGSDDWARLLFAIVPGL